jgi:CRISPR/Cas system CSM-associated protein Csm5 (group 7 of RAMP superfamily)
LNLLKEIQRNSHVAYLCIGFGKTFYHQSIGLALGDTKLVTKYVRLIGLQKSKEAQLYPITRNFTTDSLPLGWVKISLKP